MVRTCTAANGPAVIDSPASFEAGAQGVVAACRQVLQKQPRIGAVRLACFGDPGLEELRLAFPSLRVLGLADTAMARAKHQYGRFAVLTCVPAWVAMLTKRAAALGYAQHLVGVWALPINGSEMALEPERWRAALQCVADEARRQGAQVLILGGAAFAGLPALFHSDLPQVDALQAVSDHLANFVTCVCSVILRSRRRLATLLKQLKPAFPRVGGCGSPRVRTDSTGSLTELEFTMSLRPLAYRLGALIVLAVPLSAQALITIEMQQVGPNVVVTGSGTANVTALTLDSVSLGSTIWPVFLPESLVVIGSGLTSPWLGSLSGPANFGTSATASFSDSDTGDRIGIVAKKLVYLPMGYVSGTAVSGMSTWNNKSFVSLGVTPGNYVWTWGSGNTADSLVLNIGMAPVPEPGAAVLMLAGLLAVAVAVVHRQRQRRLAPI